MSDFNRYVVHVFICGNSVLTLDIWYLILHTGKSSLAVALFRLTDLAAGHIYIDGLDIGMIPRKLLRSKISTIPQDPVLFAGSLR